MSTTRNLKRFFKDFFFIEKWKEYKNYRPSKKQWQAFFKIISLPEKILFSFFFLVFVFSSFFWWRESYISNTKSVPKEGGTIKEVILGEPKNLNPLFASLNDADRDIAELTYAGLLKYDSQGNLKEDLVKNYKIENNGKTYIFVLKENIFWSDGQKISADDVVFTMNLIQNPETQSPLRIVFLGTTFKKIDKKTISFTTENPSPSFLENFTFKIIPQHIFKEIPPKEMSYSLPKTFVSSGPFKIEKILKKEDEIKKIILKKNENYYSPSYIQRFELTFAKDEKEFQRLKKEATNLSIYSFGDEVKNFKKGFDVKNLFPTRYFALFLNQENALLKNKKIKESLALATPKEKIIKEVFGGKARKVDSPFLEENKIKGDYPIYKFDIKKAKEILKSEGWEDKNKDGILEKEIDGKNYALSFTLHTVEQEELKKVANIIKENWKEIGVKLEIKTYQPQELLQNVIKERKYEILLFGNTLTMIPEPYYFWHSSQVKYPGLNLSLYQNKDVDKLLEKESKEINTQERNKALAEIQKKITEDIPAIFLYSPNYLYATKKQIKGFNGKYIIDPSKRFIGIENWYIKEKRIPKDQNYQKPKPILPTPTSNSPLSSPKKENKK